MSRFVLDGPRWAIRAATAAVLGLLPFGAMAYENIVSTAQKIEKDVQDTPISVTAFSADTIEELKLRNLDDVALFTPGVSFTSAFGRQTGSDRPTVRGITTILNGVGNSSSTGYFIDGVFLSSSPQATELANLERIEIIKGPQSTQFGRGTYAGAINYVTKGQSEEFEGNLSLSAGQDGFGEVVGWISGPINDSLGYYLSAGYDTFDGQYSNTFDGSTVGGEETRSLTAKLFFNPTDRISGTFRLGYQEVDDDHFAAYLQPRALNNCCGRGPDAPRAREYYVGDVVADWDQIALNVPLLEGTGGAGVNSDRTIISLKLDVDLAEDVTFTSVTGFIDEDIRTGIDASYAAYTPFGFAPGDFYQIDFDNQRDVSQEFRVTSTALDNTTITTGLYLYRGVVRENEDRFVSADGTISNGSGFSGGAISLEREEIENVAIFGGVEVGLTDRLTVGLEARYAEDEITVEDTAAGNCNAQLCNETFDSFTARITALLALTDNLNIYGNIANGTKPGNFNSSVPDLPGTMTPDESFRSVDEEEVISYEAGLKGTFLDGRANGTLAVYYNDIDDQQLTTVIDLGGGETISILRNVGKTEVLGVELSGAIQITDSWSAGASYAWTDAEIQEAIDPDQADLLGSNGTFAENQALGSLEGKQTPRVPEHQAAVFTRFEAQLNADVNWYAGADWTFESSKFSQVHNLAETGDRSIVGLRTGIEFGNVALEIWGKNIFDEDTPVDVLRYLDRRSGTLPSCLSQDPTANCSPFFTTSPRGFVLTAPRQAQWGMSANVRFGETT